MIEFTLPSAYQPRPVRFLELVECEGWTVKTYSISARRERVGEETLRRVRRQLPQWLKAAKAQALPKYRLATLIVHEGREGVFAIVNWWVDENMLQHFVYRATDEHPDDFVLYSDTGIVTCVWELAVLWHERNAWVEHVLKKPDRPDVAAYLNAHLNADV